LLDRLTKEKKMKSVGMSTLEKIKKNKTVDFISDERNSDDGIWAELKAGYIDPTSGVHSVHEDTPKEVWIRLRCVVKCGCEECINYLKDAATT
jgi:hypothetical protein